MQGRPATTININLPEFVEERKKNGITIFSGTNNSGKSYVMKNISANIGQDAYMLAVQRFYNAPQLTTSPTDTNKKTNIYNNLVSSLNDASQNNETNFIDLQRAITDLPDDRLDELFKICSDLIGQPFALHKVKENFRFSPSYITVGGINMAFASSGTRLLVTLIGTLLDDAYSTYLLDEPELGLTPRIQTALVDFLYNPENRKAYFSHIENLFISTHSHLFLDKKTIANNFIVENHEGAININSISSIGGFHNLQFNLLGNTFESLFLPELIVLVEGQTDYTYIKRVCEIVYPNTKIAIISAGNDNQIKPKLHIYEEMLGGISTSPYSNRIMTILDSAHSAGLPSEIEKMGIPKNNIVIWEKNGIEYYYPTEILKEIFLCDDGALASTTMDNDSNVIVNGITKSKSELCKEVIHKLNAKSEYSEEFKNKLLKRIKEIVE